MEDLENQGMLVDIININIPRGTQPEEHMHIQGHKVAQVCLPSDIIGGDMDRITCKGCS
jgi:hypothetical protein